MNLGLALEEAVVFAQYNVTVLGTSTTAIRLSEDRKLVKEELDNIEVCSAKSFGVSTVEEALIFPRFQGHMSFIIKQPFRLV